MNTNAVNVAVVDGKTITQTTELQNGGSGKPIRIKAIADGKYILAEGDKGFAPENITIKRVGKDLHVALEGTDPDQPQLIIEGFFDAQGQLVGVGEDGAYYEYISSDAEQDHSAPFLIDGVSSPQVLGSEQLVGFGNGLVAGTGIGWFWPALLGLAGLGLLGGAYAAGRAHDDDDHHDNGSASGVNTPTLDSATDNVGDHTGPIEKGGSTDDSTPTFSGVGTPGNTVIVMDGDEIIGETIVGDDGLWEFTPETPLADGAHEIVVIEEDPDGNQSDPSDGFDFVVDLTAPAKSVISDVQDDVGQLQGLVPQNGITDDNTPMLNGLAEAGSTVEVFANGVKIGETKADANGVWSYTPNPALADGEYSFTTVAVDAAGNRGLPSDPYVLVIDTSLPLISITGATDDVGSVTDPLSSGDVTDDTKPTFSGLATPNSSVNIYDNGVLIDTVISDEFGQWTYTPQTDLAEGDHSFTATVTTPAGGESAHTPVFELEIDTTAPGKPGEGLNGGIDEVTDNVGDTVGPIADGGSTDDNTPTLGGGGQEPGDVVTIIDNGVTIGEAIVEDDGTWEFTPQEPLADGSHDFTVVVTDPAGNASEESDPYNVNVDTQAPAQAVITSVVDDQGDQMGPIAGGATTDDAQPLISGTAEANSTVIIYDNGVPIGSAPVDENGVWEFTPPRPLLNGHHEVTVEAVDAAGNVGPMSDPFDFEVIAGGVAQAPAITGITDDVGVHVGNLSPNDVTDDARPTINGTGQAGTTITVYSNGVPIGTAVVGENGQWELPVPDDLAPGLNNITADATDAAGNISPETGVYPITVDTTAPAATGSEVLSDDVGAVTGQITDGMTTDDSNPTLTGTAEPESTVIIYDNGEIIDRVPVDGDGNWSYTPREPLIDGEHSFHTVVEDPAGNQSPASDPIDFTVDTSAVVISITEVIDDVGSVQDPLSNGGVTDDTRPTINGRATPNSLVTIYDNGQPIHTVMSNEDGDWTYTPTDDLIEGDHSFTATVTTPAGGESAHTAPFDLEIDITAPGTPGEGANGGIDTITDDVGAEQGLIENGGSTDDTTPTLSGGGQQAGDTVTIYDNGNPIDEVIVGEDGTWSYTPSTPLNDGQHDFTIDVTDPAGNVSEESDPYTVNVDTTAPAATGAEVLSDDVGPVTGQITDGMTTDDSHPTLTGTAEAGSTVIIYDNGEIIDRVPVNGDGNWSYTPRDPLIDGEHSFHTVVEDAAGNQSPASDPIDFIVDTREVVISITEVIDDVGSVQDPLSNGGVTDDTRPTINGQATPNSLVTIYDNGQPIRTVMSNEDGFWTYTPTDDLIEGDHSFTATVTTPAGGESPHTAPFDLEIDVTAPGTPGEGANGGIDTITDDVGAEQGLIENGGSTDDNTPTLSGGGQQAGDTVTIYDNGNPIDEVIVGENGTWSYTPPTPLDDGEHDFTIDVTDPAGNVSEESDPYTVNVDTQAPTAQATVVSMGKDSGNDSGDFLTNDGSAGRLIQGSLTAALAANEKVQVSVDGGATWLDAVLNGDGTWSFVDETVHAADWEIQTRVVDAAGNVGVEATQQVTLDTTAPNAPSSIELNGNVATVGIDGTNAVTGDTVKVVYGDSTVDHTLTEADIAAGSVDIEIPQDVIDAQPDVDSISAGVIDGQGNSSDYRWADFGSVVVNEDFSAETITHTFEGVGDTIESSSGVFRLTLVGRQSPDALSGVWVEANVASVTVSGDVEFSLKGKEATSLTFHWMNSQSTQVIEFYDSQGNMIHRGTFGGGAIDNIIDGDSTFVMPDGLMFSSFIIQPGTIPPSIQDIIQVDDIVMDVLSTETGVMPPLTEQTVVVGSDAYQGDDGNNVFNVADIAYFDGADASVSGGNGIDKLNLTGQNQVLDLTNIGEKLSSIEVIDLTGSGDNTLNLSLDDVLNNGGMDLFHESGKTQMMVNGDAGDVVDLEGLMGAEDPGNWSAQGAITVGGVTYNVYSHSSLDAELLVQQGVTTNLV